MTLVKGPADLEQFRTKVNNARWYIDPLPADGRWDPMTTAVPAVTTIKKALSKPFRKRHEASGETYPLDSYQAAQYVQDNFAELAAMHPEQRFTAVATAPTRSLAKAGDRGTAVHTVFEGYAQGIVIAPELFEDDVRPFIPACEKFAREWRPVWRMTEFLVMNRQLGYAGTADALCEFPGVTCNKCGEPFGLTVVDYKSRGSRHGAYEEEVCQLGGYASGEYVIVTGEDGQLERRDPPEIAHGAVVSLMPDGTYCVYPVEIAEARHAFLGLFETWRIRRDTERVARTAVGKPAPPPSNLASLPPSPPGHADSHSEEANAPYEPGDSEDRPQQPASAAQQRPDEKQFAPENDDLPGRASPTGEPVSGDLGTWLRTRVRTIVQSGKPLPVVWPNVPKFPSGQVTPEHFPDIERWCDDTEKLLGLPFPPEDPRAPAQPEAVAPDPPAEPRPDPREEATSWAEKGRGLLALLDDEPLARACARLAGCETVRMTRERYLALQAVVTQVSSPTGVLVASWGAGGVKVKAVGGVAEALLTQMPPLPPEDPDDPAPVITKATKTEALRRARRVAKQLGVPAAKTYAELCEPEHLLLVACVAVGHGAKNEEP